MCHHLRLICALLFPASLALAQEALPPPTAVEFARLADFPPRIPLGEPGEDGRRPDHLRLWIHYQGVLEFAALRPPAPGDPRALEAEFGDRVAPFWYAFDPPCAGRDGRPSVTARVEDGGLVVRWDGLTTGGTQCADGARLYDFAARVDVLDAAGEPVGEDAAATAALRFTFTYGDLPTDGAPRAGLVLGDAVLELLGDGEKPRTDRAEALRGQSSNNTDEAAAGLWIIELDVDGQVIGDPDLDGVREADNCPDDWNPGQENHVVPAVPGEPGPVQDEVGDACDTDHDNDGKRNANDNCPWLPNWAQADLDGDGRGDICDSDRDGDGITNLLDNCLRVANPGQFDLDFDASGDACDPDPDGDGVPTIDAQGAPRDACPWVADSVQRDGDGDGLGDACDTRPRQWADEEARRVEADADGDTWPDVMDICPFAADPQQTDRDADGIGDACDPDADGDGVLDVFQGRCFSSSVGLLGVCPAEDDGLLLVDPRVLYPAPFTRASFVP